MDIGKPIKEVKLSQSVPGARPAATPGETAARPRLTPLPEGWRVRPPALPLPATQQVHP